MRVVKIDISIEKDFLRTKTKHELTFRPLKPFEKNGPGSTK